MVVPTYDERDTVVRLPTRLAHEVPTADVLVDADSTGDETTAVAVEALTRLVLRCRETAPETEPTSTTHP